MRFSISYYTRIRRFVQEKLLRRTPQTSPGTTLCTVPRSFLFCEPNPSAASHRLTSQTPPPLRRRGLNCGFICQRGSGCSNRPPKERRQPTQPARTNAGRGDRPARAAPQKSAHRRLAADGGRRLSCGAFAAAIRGRRLRLDCLCLLRDRGRFGACNRLRSGSIRIGMPQRSSQPIRPIPANLLVHPGGKP